MCQFTIPHANVLMHKQEVMRDPVLATDGYSYERSAIEQWLRTHNTSPMSNQVTTRCNVSQSYFYFKSTCLLV